MSVIQRHHQQTRWPLKPLLASISILVLSHPFGALSQQPPQINESAFVDIKQIDPTIVVELRYAGSNNSANRALYPSSMPAMVRFSVAQRLVFAQEYLKTRGYGLKIWDAYRPQAVQERLWAATKNNDYVADPRARVGSIHTRGAAVDATLVNSFGREVTMPTEFDNFTPAAMLYYQGSDPMIRSNLKLLQKAMARAGFYGSRTEWWHFCAADWRIYPPVPEITLVAQASSPSL